ncbi:RNA ligase family protein [Bacteroides sp.]|uniref:ATP-dependent DNA ligase n=1 Tax=Bacteroides sp. TaxID=29523 RepID=UPI002606067F|nr:RNA ligase family protein [Bacteroides sp.]MDD3039559.1 RNA ligase family protein [Bacteroides sp.]
MRKGQKVGTLTNKQLLFDHLLLHKWFNQGGVEGWSKEDLVNQHVLIVLELAKRGINHPDVEDKALDDESEPFYDKKLEDSKLANFIQDLPDEMILHDEFIKIVGSFVEEWKDDPNDIDVIMPVEIPAVREFLRECGAKLPIHANVSDGSSGQYMPIYELVLRKCQRPTKYIYDYKVPLGQPVPKQQYETRNAWFMEPEFGYYIQPKLRGEHIYIHKDCDQLFVDGDVPLNEAARTILLNSGPDQYIVEAITAPSTGTVVIFDILRHSSTELTDFTLKSRMVFLEKFQLAANPFVCKVPSFWVDAWESEEAALAAVASLNVPEIIMKDDYDMYYLDGRNPNWKVITLAAPTRLKVGTPNFPALKANTGYGKFEFNDIEEAWMYWGKGFTAEGAVAIEEKYDGFRCLIHKSKDDKVWIFTEDRRRDLADNFPRTVEKLKADFKGSEFILDSELVWYDEKGMARPRQDVSYFIHGKQEKIDDKWRIDDEFVKFNIFDCLYLNGTQLVDQPWTERQKALAQVIEKDSDTLHRVIPILADNRNEFIAAIKKQAGIPGSEGAMLKYTKSNYPLDGRTTNWAKYKTVLEVHLEVMKIVTKKRSPSQIKSGDAYMYDVGYKRDGKLEQIGTTYSTGIKAKVGDILTVIPVQVIWNESDDKLTFMFPRVKEINEEIKEPDSFEMLVKVAQKT